MRWGSLSVRAMAIAIALMLSGVSAFAGTRSEVLKDGTKIEIDGDQVFVIAAVGDPCNKKPKALGNPCNKKPKAFGNPCNKPQRKPAADGTYTLKDGTLLKIRGGRLVTEEKAK